MVLLGAPETVKPAHRLGIAAVPFRSVPMKLPWMRLPVRFC